MAVNSRVCSKTTSLPPHLHPLSQHFTEDLLCARHCAVARLLKIGFYRDRLIPNMLLVKNGHHPPPLLNDSGTNKNHSF